MKRHAIILFILSLGIVLGGCHKKKSSPPTPKPFQATLTSAYTWDGSAPSLTVGAVMTGELVKNRSITYDYGMGTTTLKYNNAILFPQYVETGVLESITLSNPPATLTLYTAEGVSSWTFSYVAASN